jgi:hypothetical protein
MSERNGATTGAAGRADESAARAAKLRRNAWLLAALALFFYVGFMIWTLIRADL